VALLKNQGIDVSSDLKNYIVEATSTKKQTKNKESIINQVVGMNYRALRKKYKECGLKTRFPLESQKAIDYRVALLKNQGIDVSSDLKERLVETTSTSLRRKISSQAESSAQVKSDCATRKLTVCAENIQELQDCTTWAHGKGAGKPKFQPLMMIYDEMIQQPHLARQNEDVFRSDASGKPSPGLYFLVPRKDFDRKNFAMMLEKIASLMKNCEQDSGTDWACTNDVEELFHLAYGDKKFKTQGSNKQKGNGNRRYL